jgi:glyoxylase-like metal-dependent hydrolase (beta-lactamase superfamily II)
MKKYIKLTLLVIVTSLFLPNTKLYAQGFYRIKLGNFEVIALLDGVVPQNLDELLKGTQPGEIGKLMAAHSQTAIMSCSVNAYLINTGNKLILIDAGTGDAYGASLGHLTEALKKAGYEPGQINAVLLTHTHMDHIGGLMTGDKLTFPNAQVFLSKSEADYYLNAANREKAPETMKRFFDGAAQKLNPIIQAGKLTTFEFGKELFPGITPVASFGHSAGHTFYAVKSKGAKMLFWGDIILSDIIQFANPAVTSVYDYNELSSIAIRKKALKEADTEHYLVAVSHIDFPGIGHIIKVDTGYRFVSVK